MATKSIPRSERKVLPLFGAYLKSLREQKVMPPKGRRKVSREAFATMLGCSKGLIDEYERGTCYDPSPELLRKIAAAAGISLEEVVLKLVEEKYRVGGKNYYLIYRA